MADQKQEKQEKGKVTRPRRQNRDRATIAQERLDAEQSRLDKATAKQKALRQEADALDAKIAEHQRRVEYLRQDPDLPQSEPQQVGVPV